MLGLRKELLSQNHIYRTYKFFTAATQPETNTEEIDHLPIPAFDESFFWDGGDDRQGWPRIRKRRTIFRGDFMNYVDAIQAFDVRTFWKCKQL